MKQMNSEQYVMCSDTSQDYLGNGYNSRNENTKGEVEQNMTHKTKVTYKTDTNTNTKNLKASYLCRKEQGEWNSHF